MIQKKRRQSLYNDQKISKSLSKLIKSFKSEELQPSESSHFAPSDLDKEGGQEIS